MKWKTCCMLTLSVLCSAWGRVWHCMALQYVVVPVTVLLLCWHILHAVVYSRPTLHGCVVCSLAFLQGSSVSVLVPFLGWFCWVQPRENYSCRNDWVDRGFRSHVRPKIERFNSVTETARACFFVQCLYYFCCSVSMPWIVVAIWERLAHSKRNVGVGQSLLSCFVLPTSAICSLHKNLMLAPLYPFMAEVCRAFSWLPFPPLFPLMGKRAKFSQSEI